MQSSLLVYKHLVEIENSSVQGRAPLNEMKEKILKEFLEQHDHHQLSYCYDGDRALYTKE